MKTFCQIDWNQAWKADRGPRNHAGKSEFWNKRAASFAQHVKSSDNEDYVDPFLAIADAQPDWSVLDVGCGPGTLALPLAQQVRQVTAIDFSQTMLDILEERRAALGLTNVTAKQISWEDDWAACGLVPHDLVIASRSLATDEPLEALTKMNAFASRRACASCAVGSGPTDYRILEAVGRPYHHNPDYIYIVNLLYQMGIHANVRMIDKALRAFTDEDDAVSALSWMLDAMTPSEEEALRRFIAAHLVRYGQKWRLDYQGPVRWATIWWDKPDYR